VYRVANYKQYRTPPYRNTPPSHLHPYISELTMGTGNSYASKRQIGLGLFAVIFIVSINLYIGEHGSTSSPTDSLQTEAATSSTSSTSADDDSNNTAEKATQKAKEDSNKTAEKATKKSEKFSANQLYQCAEHDPDLWSNRPFPTSKVESLYNCDLPDALCKYYYPASFFHESCGLGKEFVHHIEDAKAKKLNGTLWNFMPAVGFPTVTMNNTCLNVGDGSMYRDASAVAGRVDDKTVLKNIGNHLNDDEDAQIKCMTERLSFLHVHKAGGSSLHNAFNFVSQSKNAQLVRHKFFSPSTNPGAQPKQMTVQGAKMYNFTLKSLLHATKYPDEEFAPEQHVIFAAVRDPTERFISSIGQALGAQGSGGNHIGPILKKECIKENSQETLRCLAHYVQDHGFWIELHFTPQVIDISFTTMWQDVPISIFSFKDLKTILDYFGRGSVQVRDGGAKNYRSDPVLTNMTVADYDEDSLRVVCEIYEMDVRMQRSLGMEVPRCDPFIPRSYDFEK